MEFADFLVLSQDFGTSGESLADLDCNGEVDFADFLTLSVNFGSAVGATQSVPEPASNSMAVLSLALVGVLLRR